MTPAYASEQDLAVVAEVETAVRVLRDQLEATAPALKRLDAAKYAGAGAVLASLADVDLGDLVEELERMREAGGELGAWLSQRYTGLAELVDAIADEAAIAAFVDYRRRAGLPLSSRRRRP